MTIVRGRKPLKLRSAATIDPQSHALTIKVSVRGWDDSGNAFDAVGVLSPECAVTLIRELRQALRKVRDDCTSRLDRAVRNAEGEL